MLHCVDSARAPPGALLTIEDTTELSDIADRAATETLRLTGAVAAAAYIEGPGGNPVFAAAGEFPVPEGELRARSLTILATAGERALGLLAGEPGTVVVPFRVDAVRGALLAERPAFGAGAEGRILGHLAELVGVTAASIPHRDRFRLLERTQGAIADAISEGVLAISEGMVSLLNRAGGELLGMAPAETLGRTVDEIWPDLGRALESGRPFDRQPIRFQRTVLLVTSRPILGARRTTCAAVSFVASPEAASGRQVRSPLPESTLAGLIGVTVAIAHIRDVARIAARSASSVLIEGESGVGKEVLAQAIHSMGGRARKPFVAVLCAAIPRELLESELFGYEPGSFTGANPRGRAGKFELAEGGTLLLDDIVDMPLDMQAKLLRVLQEHVVTRLGGSRPRPIDVRILATSNRSMCEAVRAGVFRADLYYRLNVLKVEIPPLRERRQDIKPLAEHFLCKHAPEHGSELRTVGAEALRALESHTWPGNVRELEHCIESEIHFASPTDTCLQRLSRPVSLVGPQRTSGARTLLELERDLYAGALASSEGDIKRAAKDLGISRGKLYRKLRLHELLPVNSTARSAQVGVPPRL